jgi:transposase-like protein
MAKNQRKVASAKSSLVAKLPLACSDERAAVEFMEEQRWGDSPCCPRCGDMDVYKMQDTRTRERSKRWLWRCRGCVRQYTVRVGTVMEDSAIPLQHWCYAFWAACAGKKGVSALQICRQTGLSYKSALFLMHRIRYAMAPANEAEAKLSGDVEADETYVGGKPRKPNFPGGTPRRWLKYRAEYQKRPLGPAPDFKDRKTPVFAAVERGGRVRARVVPNVNPESMKAALVEVVDPSARLLTDTSPVYERVGKTFAGGHETVNHSALEYVRGDVHTNTVEGFFGLLKRRINGTHHSVSRKHLHRYVAESTFVYNHRGLDDGERTQVAIQSAEGKRLTYRGQVDAEKGGE